MSPRVEFDTINSLTVDVSFESIAIGLIEGDESPDADENEFDARGRFFTGPRDRSSITLIFSFLLLFDVLFALDQLIHLHLM